MWQKTRLSAALWLKIDWSAVYLHNWMSRYDYNWKLLYECFHIYLAHQDETVASNCKSQQTHLKMYDCKIFVLTTEYLKKKKWFQKFNFKTWIDYLIEYDFINVYRIWNLMMNKIIWVRDVIFNENEVFDDNLDKMRDDCLYIELNELAQLLISLDTSSESEKINLKSNNCMLADNSEDLDENLYELEINESQDFDLLV